MPENLERRGAKGTWYFRAMIGGRLYRRSTGFRDLKSAQRRASDFERDIRAGIVWGDKPVPAFETWAEKALQIIMGGKKDPDRELLSAAHAIKLWQGRKLSEIKPSDCEDYVQVRLKAGAAKGTVAREIVVLSRMFRLAVSDEILARNPWADVRRVAGDARTRVLTLEEERRLREHLPLVWDRYLTVALLTGLRVSEQLGLRPVDVRDGMVMVRAEHAKRGKAREVPLRPEASEALIAQAPAHKEARYWPFERHVVAYYLEKAREQARIGRFRIHDFRRTFGTRCAEAGMLPLHLMKIMGHSSVETTAKYYVHLARLSIVDAMSKAVIPVEVQLSHTDETSRDAQAK